MSCADTLSKTLHISPTHNSHLAFLALASAEQNLLNFRASEVSRAQRISITFEGLQIHSLLPYKFWLPMQTAHKKHPNSLLPSSQEGEPPNG